jgi:hypothetical protein
MIDGIHDYAANLRATTQPAGPASFAEDDFVVIQIANLADCGCTFDTHLANLA